MSSSAKFAPALTLGGRVWRLQKEVGRIANAKMTFGNGFTPSSVQLNTFSQKNLNDGSINCKGFAEKWGKMPFQ